MVLIRVQNNEGKNLNVDSFSPFYFVLFGDIQYGMIRNNEGWIEERNLLKNAIEKTNKLNPPFVIAMGDLSNETPFNERQNEQYRDLKEDFKLLNKSTDLYVFCGNHDVRDKPTCETLQYFEDNWGDSYYSFIHNNCCFVILNSTLLYDDSCVMELREKQLQWLEETLKKADSLKVKHKFLFMHHPLLYDDIYEEEDIGVIYFEKITKCIPKNRFHIKKHNRMIIYNLMKKYNVNYIFCAHLHFNKEVQIDEKRKQIVISAVGMQVRNDESGVLVVKVEEKRVNYKYYPLQYIPEEVCLC